MILHRWLLYRSWLLLHLLHELRLMNVVSIGTHSIILLRLRPLGLFLLLNHLIHLLLLVWVTLIIGNVVQCTIVGDVATLLLLLIVIVPLLVNSRIGNLVMIVAVLLVAVLLLLVSGIQSLLGLLVLLLLLLLHSYHVLKGLMLFTALGKILVWRHLRRVVVETILLLTTWFDNHLILSHNLDLHWISTRWSPLLLHLLLLQKLLYLWVHIPIILWLRLLSLRHHWALWVTQDLMHHALLLAWILRLKHASHRGSIWPTNPKLLILHLCLLRGLQLLLLLHVLRGLLEALLVWSAVFGHKHLMETVLPLNGSASLPTER